MSALAALTVFSLSAASAQATAPTLLTAGRSARHITATWSLPPGVQAEEIEVGRSPATDADGSFASFEDADVLGGTQTSWRSEDAFEPGTYYVHVSGSDPSCDECPIEEWSNVLRVVIVRPPPPVPRAGRYSGRTEFPDSGPISFTLAPNLKSVRRLKVSYDLDCSRRGFPTGELRGQVTFLRPIPVRADGSFSRVAHFGVVFRGGGPRGSITVTVKGKLRPRERATGTVRPRAALGGGERCVSFPLRTPGWSARHA